MTHIFIISSITKPVLSFSNLNRIRIRATTSYITSECRRNQSIYISASIVRRTTRARNFHSSISIKSQNDHHHHGGGYIVTDANGRPQSRFLDEVEESIHNVFQKHNIKYTPAKHATHRIDINTIIDNIQPPSQREAVGVAISLYNRIFSLTRNGDCRRCWFQAAHCICDSIPSLEQHGTSQGVIPNVHRLFLLIHHKEIGMTVDTAKLILACFENTCRLVVGGIGSEYQPSMRELIDATQQRERRCMVLFPSEDAMTYVDLKQHVEESMKTDDPRDLLGNDYVDDRWDIIVIDGTWSQARKLYTRYIPTTSSNDEQGSYSPFQVCLSQEAVRILDGGNGSNENNVVKGRQLRRHPIKWREVSTLEATRLLIRDIMKEEGEVEEKEEKKLLGKKDGEKNGSNEEKEPCYDILAKYQCISDAKAKKQLGPPRVKSSG